MTGCRRGTHSFECGACVRMWRTKWTAGTRISCYWLMYYPMWRTLEDTLICTLYTQAAGPRLKHKNIFIDLVKLTFKFSKYQYFFIFIYFI